MAKTGEAAAYVRVSSASQTAAMQLDAIHRAAAARGDTIRPTEMYADTMSGKTIARPNLQRMRAAVRAGEIRRLYVFRLDRLTRSGFRDMFDLIEDFKRHGCELVTIADGFDVSAPGPASEIVLFMISWAAKYERLAIGERIAAARVRVEAKGGAWGRPKREIDARLIDRAVVMRKQGKTQRYIAAALKIPRSTLKDALRGLGEKPTAKKLRPGPLKRARSA